MKLIQLHYFQTICQYNNMTRAAEALHISQPSLSAAIKELEEEFGMTLFHRLNKGLALTDEGQIFLQEALELLNHADTFTTHMHTLGKSKQTIRLGLPPMSSSLVFPKLMAAFNQQYPHVKIEMIENGSLTNKKMISDGSLDAAIITSVNSLPSTYGHVTLSNPSLYFFISKNNPLAQYQMLSIQDILHTPLVLTTDDSFLKKYITQSFKDQDISPHILLLTNQIMIIQQLVENNTAGTFLFDGVLIENDKFVKIPVRELSQPQIYLIWNAHSQLSMATQQLIKTARAAFR